MAKRIFDWRRTGAVALLLLSGLLIPSSLCGQETVDAPLVVTDYLVVPKVGEYGRQSLHQDPIEYLLVTDTWKPPTPGQAVLKAGGGVANWQKANVSKDGEITDSELAGGYAYATIESSEERVMLLHATKHASACLNGQWLAGDPYGKGNLKLPVVLKKGNNELLLHIAQPGCRAEFIEPSAIVSLQADEAVLPTVAKAGAQQTQVEKNTAEPLWASIPILNASREPLVDLEIVSNLSEGEVTKTPVPRVEPLSVYNAKFMFLPKANASGDQELTVSLRRANHSNDSGDEQPNQADEPDLSEVELTLRAVEPTAIQTWTFVSRIDGGVQRYAVRLASESKEQTEKPGVLLTLHGLGVGCEAHLTNYQAKPWAHLVAPQGRSDYGFDWEDWSQRDAIEALDDALSQPVIKSNYNAQRQWLTGYSTGGHGAWKLAIDQPDRFAAVGTSAGWVSFWTYGGAPTPNAPTAVEAMLHRSNAASDLLLATRNLAGQGVYLLHGAKDAVVPPSQSRFLRSRLSEFHTDFAYFEKPDAEHWWGSSTCDFAPMMRFFETRSLKQSKATDQIDFSTASLNTSYRDRWVTIHAQQSPLEVSRVVARRDRQLRVMRIRTENVSVLELDVSDLGTTGRISILADRGPLIRIARPARAQKVWLTKNSRGGWQETRRPNPKNKSPRRAGGLKSAFDNNALLVYGTSGSVGEQAWARAKAQYDAQTFGYRGGSLEVIPDTAFDARRQPGRNIVLYGNADTNKAWPDLLSTCPVQIRGGTAYVGVRPETDNQLAVAFVRPRRGTTSATVAVIGGTGLAGMKLTNRMRYFISGAGFPDLLIYGPETLRTGAGDVRAVGYFGNDWEVKTGEIIWRDLAL